MFQEESPYFRERKLTVPAKFIPEIGNDPRQFNTCYINRPDTPIKKLFKSYAPLIEKGRLLIRPLRGLHVNHPGTNAGSIYYVDPNTPNDHWYINELQDKGNIVIDNGLNEIQMVKLFQLTVPFFEGVPIETLANILHDETLILSTFRNQLKKMIQEVGDNLDDLKTLQDDTIRPAIDTLERKFKTIKGTHRLSIGVSVGCFSLTLIVGYYKGNLMQLLTGAIPALGGALVLSERGYRDKMSDLKDNPFFLLWRIERAKV